MSNLLQQTEAILAKLDPRFMASDPWRTIDQALESLIDKIVLELNQTTDENIARDLDEWDNRVDAIDYLIEKLQKMKAE